MIRNRWIMRKGYKQQEYCSWAEIGPRAGNCCSHLPFAEGLPLIQEMARRRKLDAGSGRKSFPTWSRTKIYGFRDHRATITRACCTTGQMLRMAVSGISSGRMTRAASGVLRLLPAFFESEEAPYSTNHVASLGSDNHER
jgi:hypothetical protein